MPTANQVTAALTPCAMPNHDGDTCGKPGMVGLLAGICQDHAIAVFRAVNRLAAERKGPK